MKITRITLVYWITFFLTFALYQFGFAISVPFSNDPIPFAIAWNSAEWSRAFRIHTGDDYFYIFLAGFLASLLLPFLKREGHRALLLGAVSFLGMAHFDFVMSVLTFFSLYLVASEFLGHLDGESYSEGMHQGGAAGLLLLCSFLATLRYSWRLYQNR